MFDLNASPEEDPRIRLLMECTGRRVRVHRVSGFLGDALVIVSNKTGERRELDYEKLLEFAREKGVLQAVIDAARQLTSHEVAGERYRARYWIRRKRRSQ